MVRDIDDGALVAHVTAAVKERGFNQPRRLIVEQTVPWFC
jgi:hypothetical protein